eukprot:13516818-Alexandrium_andersonii.AAC.1
MSAVAREKCHTLLLGARPGISRDQMQAWSEQRAPLKLVPVPLQTVPGWLQAAFARDKPQPSQERQ